MTKFTNNFYEFSQSATTWNTRICIQSITGGTLKETLNGKTDIQAGNIPEEAKEYIITDIEIQPQLNKIWVKVRIKVPCCWSVQEGHSHTKEELWKLITGQS